MKYSGEVKWFNASRGFGFINSDAFPEEDIFVHFSYIEMEGYKALKANQKVFFEVEQKPTGLHAKQVDPVPEEIAVE